MIDYIEKLRAYLDDEAEFQEGARGKWRYKVRGGDDNWKTFDGDLNKFRPAFGYQVERRPFGYERGGYFVEPINPEFPPAHGTIVYQPHAYSAAPLYVNTLQFMPANPDHQRLLNEYGLFETEEKAQVAIKADISDRIDKING